MAAVSMNSCLAGSRLGGEFSPSSPCLRPATLCKVQPAFGGCAYYSLATKCKGWLLGVHTNAHSPHRNQGCRRLKFPSTQQLSPKLSGTRLAAIADAGGVVKEQAPTDGEASRAGDPARKRQLRLTSRGIVWSDDEVEKKLESARTWLGPWHVDMVKWRRQIHAYPELAFQENATADLVAGLLETWGYEVDRSMGGTGIVATLRVGEPRPDQQAIMLRADMDALPIEELNTFQHRSQKPMAMHACGHDGHTAMLLGAARALAEQRSFEGTVHLLFQPAEEGTETENEGGREGGGAACMLDEGLLEKYPVKAAYGMHNWPGLPVGRFAIHSGPVMAAVDTWEIMVEGLGCHAAMPHLAKGRDPIVCAAHIVTAIQTLVSRRVDPQDCAVLSVTQIHGGDAHNVIPPQVWMQGTLRTFRSSTRDAMMAGLKEVASSVAAAFGCVAKVTFMQSFPATVNTAREARLSAAAARAVVGDDFVDLDSVPPSMGAEDFGYILERVPGCYMWIGNGPTEGGCMLHNPRYDFDDDILALGAAYWVRLVELALPVTTK